MNNSKSNSPSRSPSFFTDSTWSSSGIDKVRNERNKMSATKNQANIDAPSGISCTPVTDSGSKLKQPMNNVELCRELGIKLPEKLNTKPFQPKRAPELFAELYPELDSDQIKEKVIQFSISNQVNIDAPSGNFGISAHPPRTTSITKVVKPMNHLELSRELGIAVDVKTESQLFQPKKSHELFLELYPESARKSPNRIKEGARQQLWSIKKPKLLTKKKIPTSTVVLSRTSQLIKMGDLDENPNRLKKMPVTRSSSVTLVKPIQVKPHTVTKSMPQKQKIEKSIVNKQINSKNTDIDLQSMYALVKSNNDMLNTLLKRLDDLENRFNLYEHQTFISQQNVQTAPITTNNLDNKSPEIKIPAVSIYDGNGQLLYNNTGNSNILIDDLTNKAPHLRELNTIKTSTDNILDELNLFGNEINKTNDNEQSHTKNVIVESSISNIELPSHDSFDVGITEHRNKHHNFILPKSNLENISPNLYTEKPNITLEQNLDVDNFSNLNETVIEHSQNHDLKVNDEFDLSFTLKPLKTTFEQLESRLENDSLATTHLSESDTESPLINMTWLLHDLNKSNSQKPLTSLPNHVVVTKNRSSQDVHGCTITAYNEMRNNLPLLCTPKTDKNQELMTPSVKNSNKKLLSRRIQKQLFMLNNKF